MTDIYFDSSSLRSPEAADRIAHLRDAGNRLFLVGELPPGLDEALSLATRVAALPADPARGSWFVSADPASCAERRPGLRTLLIGPRRTSAGAPQGPRCDAQARDLAAAVLEILGRDAMG